MPELQTKYWAFISYSHQDEAWARWLHRRLETWRVPRRLVGLPHPDGVIPRRLQPVFRDVDELASSAELGAVINRALAESRYQIVICSPRSAASRWVNEEIRYFKALGRESRVLALIVDGEPNALDTAQECFAPSLKWRIRADGSPGDVAVEPIAADARDGRDGREGALLKLLAGMLDVGYDELVQREHRRRLWNRLRMSLVAAAVIATVAGAWIAFDRYRAEQALQYRITDLYQSGRRELLAHNEARAAVLLNEVRKLGVDTPALRYMLGRVMRVVDSQRLRFDTGSAVLGIELSPDGKRLFTVGADWHLRLWDIETRSKLADIALGDVDELGAAFSPRGTWISIDSDHATAPPRRLRIFDASNGALALQVLPAKRTGEAVLRDVDDDDRYLTYVRPDRQLARFDLQRRTESTIAGQYTVSTFCRGGAALLAGGENGEVVRIDGNTGKALQRYAGLKGAVTAIDSSHGCGVLTAGTAQGAFRIWDSDTARPLMIGGNHRGVAELRLSGDGSRLMSFARSSVSVWNGSDGGLIYSARFQDPNGVLATISPDGQRLAILSQSHLALIDPLSASEQYSLDGHEGAPQSFAFGADGRLFVSGGADGSVALWTLPDDALADHLQGAAAIAAEEVPAAPVAFSPRGDRYFAGGADGAGAVWDSQNGQQIFAVSGHDAPMRAAAFSADGSLLATGGHDAQIRIWDTRDGALTQRFTNLGGRVRLLDFSPTGPILAAQIGATDTRLWDARTGAAIADFVRDELRAAAFSPDGTVYSYGAHGAVTAWDVARRTPRWTTPLPVDDEIDSGVGVVAYSPDGRWILATLTSRQAWILDSHDGRLLYRMNAPSSTSFNAGAFSPDSHRVVLADSAKALQLWEPESGRIRTLAGHTAAVRAAAFSPDGALILSAGDDGLLRIWDGLSGELLDSFAAHDGRIWTGNALFSPDGRRVLTGGTDNRARLWLMPEEIRGPQQLAASIACRVGWRLDQLQLRPSVLAAPDCLLPADGASAALRRP